MWVFNLIELQFEDVGFCGGWKTGELGEKLSEQGQNPRQTQPKNDTGLELNPGHIGGRRRSHHFAIPDPRFNYVAFTLHCSYHNYIFFHSCIDCGSISQNLSDDFAVSVEAWHLLNTHSDYKNGTL